MKGAFILFLSPSFLMYRLHKPLRGVQVFDLLLVRQMAELGHRVVVPADGTWRARFDDLLAGAAIEPVYTRSLRKLWLNALVAERLLRRRRFDAMIVSDNARGVLPTVRRLIARRASHQTTLIANRMARPEFIHRVRGLPIRVMGVNREITAAFAGVVKGPVETRYGVPNASLFYPRTEPAREGAPVRFVMLGRLDTRLKRADRALAALERLPAEVRQNVELHLASYPKPPADLPKGVTAYTWTPIERIPELLREMDALLMLSEDETFCQAMVQAMLTGLPSVVSPVKALMEKLDDGGGFIVRDDEELVDAMTMLARDGALRARLGAEARRTALARYVWNTEAFLEDICFGSANAAAPSREKLHSQSANLR